MSASTYQSPPPELPEFRETPVWRLRIFGLHFEMHPVVFPVAATLLLMFVAVVAWMPRRSLLVFDSLQQTIATQFGWLYLIAMTGFLVLVIWLAFSRFGHIRLGPDDVPPKYPRWAWFAMLFSAGMGIGMLFFGVAEPMAHFSSPLEGPPGTPSTARSAMALTLFHWCLHPWGLYALVAMSLAYFHFRRGLPLSLRSAFYPFLGNKIYGRWGDAIDVLALLATLFGLATSLGLGAKQVNAGLAFVFGLPTSTTMQVALIAIITAMAVASLVSGLDVGIRRLSELNMGLAGGLLVFLFVAGPTTHLLSAVVDNTGVYLSQLPRRSFWAATYVSEDQAGWLSGWTLFYWGWWIAWSPFVGMFIARISQGRTIREFVAGVLLVPTAVAIFWLTGFGNTAIQQTLAAEQNAADGAVDADQNDPFSARHDYSVLVMDETSGLPMSADRQWLVGPDATAIATPRNVMMKLQDGQLVTKAGVPVEYRRGVLFNADTNQVHDPAAESLHQGAFLTETKALSLGGYLAEPVTNAAGTRRIDTTSTAMFVMLRGLPLSVLTALIGTICVILFFVTSSDSASFVADMIGSGGRPQPALGTRLFWGILEGLLAAVLLLAGGLKALQTGAITTGLPFCVLVCVMAFALVKALRNETKVVAADDEASPSDPQRIPA